MNKNNKAFTIIELLVVIAISAVLVSIVLVNVGSFRAKARDARRVADLQNIRKALDMYFIDNGFYPSVPCGYDCNGYIDSTMSDWQTLENSLKPYLSSLPRDPVNNCRAWNADCYSYVYGAVGRYGYTPQYDLHCQLEIKDNPLACKFKHYMFFFNSYYGWCTPPSSGIQNDYIYEVSP